MLTISEIAHQYQLSNRQVNDLLQYGYLHIAQIDRSHGQSIIYLFSEAEVDGLDIPSILQEIKELKQKRPWLARNQTAEFKKMVNVFSYYDRFMENMSTYAEFDFLKICFYLFHLNHYAKKNISSSQELYHLKNRVLKKLYLHNPQLIQLTYLVGPDRQKIWLCEDCKDAANTANMSYVNYLRAGNYCPKCSILTCELEYYSLVEFKIQLENVKFNFHLPRSVAGKWLDLAKLPQENRHGYHYQDQLYWYGRSITRIEEQAMPLAFVVQTLQDYLKA